MEAYRDSQGRTLVRLESVSVKVYDNGENELAKLLWDPQTKHMLTQTLGSVEQPAQTPFSVPELLVMAAMEYHEQYLRETDQLP